MPSYPSLLSLNTSAPPQLFLFPTSPQPIIPAAHIFNSWAPLHCPNGTPFTTPNGASKLIQSVLSLNLSIRPPRSFPSIVAQASEFVIQGEIGHDAYGLVKKAREMKEDGMLGISDAMRAFANHAPTTFNSLRS